jgi:hypothetical protein
MGGQTYNSVMGTLAAAVELPQRCIPHRNNRRIAIFKLEAQERATPNTWEIHQELQGRLKTFQQQHVDDHDQIENLHFDSKQCWIVLAKLFLDGCESVILVENIPLTEFFTRRAGIG